MRIKKFLALFLVCAIAVGALSLTASADTRQGDDFLRMEDMKCELIDVSKAEVLEESSMRATLTAGETNKAAHISKIKSVGSDPKPVTHKTLKSVLADCRGPDGLAGGGLALTKL